MLKRRPNLTLVIPENPIVKKLEEIGLSTADNTKIIDIIGNLKMMDRKQINEIFDNIFITSKEDFLVERVKDEDREVVRIILPITKQGTLFYKSTGTSRGIPDIKDIWFPLYKIDYSPLKEHKFVKAEAKYISAWNNFLMGDMKEDTISLVREIVTNPDIYKYGRFLDKENAKISKMLSLYNF